MNKAAEHQKFRLKKTGIGILISLYIIEVLGLLSPLFDWFVYFLSALLLVTVGMLWIDSKVGNALGWPVAITIIVMGYVLEIISVKTGSFYGEYSYSLLLGWKIWEVPPAIGIIWLILIWGSFSLFRSFRIPKLLRWFFTALLTSVILLMQKPVWIEFDIATWNEFYSYFRMGGIYFLISGVMAIIFENYPLVQKPRLGIVAIVCQFLFFGILLLSIY